MHWADMTQQPLVVCRADTQVESSHREAVLFRHQEVEPLGVQLETALDTARQGTDSHPDSAKTTAEATDDSTQ